MNLTNFLQKGLMTFAFMIIPVTLIKHFDWQMSELWKVYLPVMILGIIVTFILSLWIIPEYLGRRRKIAFTWSLVACVFLTPLIGLIITLVSPKLDEFKKEIQTIKTENSKLDNSLHNLSELKQKGILTDEEYTQKVSKLNSEKIEKELKNSIEYKQLKSLLDSGILTKEEFEKKIKLLNVLTDKEVNIEEINSIVNSGNKAYLNYLGKED